MQTGHRTSVERTCGQLIGLGFTGSSRTCGPQPNPKYNDGYLFQFYIKILNYDENKGSKIDLMWNFIHCNGNVEREFYFPQ